MLNKTLDNTSVIKLKKLIASRYGKSLEIRQLMDLSGMGEETKAWLRGRDLHIPIQVNGSILGTAVVPEADDLDIKGQSDLAQMVQMILEPTLYSWYLERKENNLNQLASAQFSTENIQLFGEKLPDIEEIDEEIRLASLARPQLVSNFIHLEGKNILMVKKAALQLHELTHRWGFVPFADIRSQLKSALDLANMGAMTIFIENIETLDVEGQELLLEYVSSPRSDEEPLVVTTSAIRLKDLKNTTIHSHLMDEMEVNVFEVDRTPLSHGKLKEVLELFFLKSTEFQS
jgi:hypothetical protein